MRPFDPDGPKESGELVGVPLGGIWPGWLVAFARARQVHCDAPEVLGVRRKLEGVAGVVGGEIGDEQQGLALALLLVVDGEPEGLDLWHRCSLTLWQRPRSYEPPGCVSTPSRAGDCRGLGCRPITGAEYSSGSPNFRRRIAPSPAPGRGCPGVMTANRRCGGRGRGRRGRLPAGRLSRGPRGGRRPGFEAEAGGLEPTGLGHVRNLALDSYRRVTSHLRRRARGFVCRTHSRCDLPGNWRMGRLGLESRTLGLKGS